MGEVAREMVLARALRTVSDDYDVVLIDCQPSLGLLAVNALTAAHGVIIPLECEFFALRGVALLVETIEKVQDRLNPRLEIDGILATMYDGRTLHSREVVARVVDAFGDLVFHTVIGRTVKFPDATVAAEPITVYASTHAGAEAYRQAGPRGSSRAATRPEPRARRGPPRAGRRARRPAHGAWSLGAVRGAPRRVQRAVRPAARAHLQAQGSTSPRWRWPR
ncbi:hypothetical protein GCM10025868_44840 [Angustibacter aerolatus]|uniref:AAA domain-containing protein n=1 Tax=Angustibacter aerolatus TaxID=1162965 RepID=A0ABQ6JMT8_9ACTN|nr:hypothetical protein GCM10025868_44840 [Angustibacter aerolatus]